MNRRNFLLTTAGAAVAPALPKTRITLETTVLAPQAFLAYEGIPIHLVEALLNKESARFFYGNGVPSPRFFGLSELYDPA